MTISQKLIVEFIVTISLPLILISALMIDQLRGHAFEAFNDATTREVAQIDNAIQLYFKEIEKNVNYLVNHDRVIRVLEENAVTRYLLNNKEVKMTPMTNNEYEAKAFSLYSDFGESHPGIAYIYIGTHTGGYLAWPQGSMSANYDPRPRPWYQAGVNANGKTHRTNAYYWQVDDAVIVSTVKAVKAPDGTILGIQGMDVSLKGLTKMVRNIKLGESGYLMLVEDNGTILVDPYNPDNNFKAIEEASNKIFQPFISIDNGSADITLDGHNYLANIYTSPNLGWKFIGLLKKSEVYATANRITMVIVAISVGLVLVFSLLAIVFARFISNPIKEVTQGLQEIAAGGGNLSQRLKIRGKDETGQLANCFNDFLSSISALVGEINDSATKINGSASETSTVSNKLNRFVHQQQNALESVATAITQMAASSNEVANNCTSAAESAKQTQQTADAGQQVIAQAVKSVKQLGDTLREATTDIDGLHTESENMISILEEIRDIAEQTNLLALNAAIESARAGSQGRGFAVVADEVRALSVRTYESTEEISSQLEKLSAMTQSLSKEMKSGLAESEVTVDFTDETKQAFDSITASVQQISDMNMEIARSSQQQHHVAEGINRNIANIKQAAEEVVEVADKAEENTDHLNKLSTHLSSLVKKFTI